LSDIFYFCQSYSKRHVSLGTFGEQLLNNIGHKMMSVEKQ
jgi:hypothetical protein